MISFDRRGVPVEDYGARGTSSVYLAGGSGPSHAYALRFDPGGQIGTHETGFGQVFVVTSGVAWVDVEGNRVDVLAGTAVIIPRGVRHSKGSEHGATVIMIQMFDLDESTSAER